MASSIFKISFLIYSLFFSINFVYADISLPSPQDKGGIGIFDALKKRASTQSGAFSAGNVSNEELSTVLWAATGLNRGKHGWTIPLVKGLEPYVRIYVTSKNGTFLYHPDSNSLEEINDKDLRGDVSFASFSKRASYVLIFVPDSKVLSDLKGKEDINSFYNIAVGAMTQNIYLSSASLKLDTRYIRAVNPEITINELNLSSDESPIGLLLLSK